MKKEDKYTSGIGVMSGTSLDGLDLAFCTFSGEANFEILEFKSLAYPKEIVNILVKSYTMPKESLVANEEEYSRFTADVINDFINEFNLKPDFIACHGHTIFHKPEKGYTFQMLNGARVRDITGVTTVCDFRTKDIQLGGQGAPLVPIGDKLLFNSYSGCLNLGGFANLSYEKDESRIAFDICPVNIVLNELVAHLGIAYDDEGKLARLGKLDPELLHKLNSLAYYKSTPPKSLGREWVEKNIYPLFRIYSMEVCLKTFVEHIAQQISNTFSLASAENVLCTGGGVYNLYLIERLKHYSSCELTLPEKLLIEGKEALIFALLGKLRLEGKTNVLSSVTGAKTDSSSGKVYHTLK